MGLLDDPTSFLESEDFEIDGEVRLPTGLICPGCGNEIEADDDVALVQVVQASIHRGRFEVYPVIGENKDFKYPPKFFHLRPCWSDLLTDLEKIGEGNKVEDLLGRIPCETCGSGIRDGETLVQAEYGEFHTDPRRPNNQEAKIYKFKALQEAEASSEICLSCILNIVDNELAEWEDLSECGECGYCTHRRCWRIAQCGCECHQ